MLPLEGKHILLIRPGALGDAILTLPLLNALLHCGAARVTILGTAKNWANINSSMSPIQVFELNDLQWIWLFADDVRPDEHRKALLKEVDLVLLCLNDPENKIRARIQLFCSAKILLLPVPVFMQDSGMKWYAHAAYTLPEKHHAARITMDPLLYALGYAFDPKRWQRLLFDLARPLLEPCILEARTAGPWVLHPGSGGRRMGKCWPLPSFKRLIESIADRQSGEIIVLLGPVELEDPEVTQWRRHLPHQVGVLENVGLKQLSLVLNRAGCFIGNDAGVTHLAARYAPTLALFGPTDPQVWRPLGACVEVLKSVDGRMDTLSVEAAFTRAVVTYARGMQIVS